MRTVISIGFLASLVLAACGDNIKQSPDDATTPDAPPDATQPVASGACIDRPTDLPAPPMGPLSCDLLPPGFEVAP